MTSELHYKQSKINWKRNALFLLAILLFTATLFYRRADAFTNPQFWAEDGMVFFMEQDHHEAFIPFKNYNGYIHFLPRCIAYTAKLTNIPYEYVPHFYNLITYLFYIFFFGLIWKLLTYSNLTKTLLILSAGILPIATEVYMNVTNLQWFSSIALILLLMDFKISSKFDLAYLTSGILLAGLTGPFSVMIAPLLLIKFFVERKNKTIWLPIIIALIMGSIQLLFLLNHYQGRPFPPIPIPKNHLGVMLYNIIKQTLFFDHRLIAEFRWRHLVLIIPVLGFYFTLLIWSLRNRKITVVLLLSYILLNAFFTIKVNWPFEWLMSPFLGGMRYFFIPFMATSWIILLLLEKKPILQFAFIGILIANFLIHGKWVRSTFVDFNWKNEVKEYKEKGEVIAPINPPGWFVIFKQKNK